MSQCWCLVGAMLCVAPNASGLLRLELTKGVRAAVPVLMLPFSGDDSALPNALRPSWVIDHDLRLSGRVRILPATGEHAVLDPKTFDPKPYTKLGANLIVFGQVDRGITGEYTVSVTVADPYEKLDGQRQALASFSVKTDRAHLRHAAHQLGDFVYAKITGVKGDFASKIAYVQMLHRKGYRNRYALMIADQDGYHPQAMLRSYLPLMSPRWSPDGTQLAYVSFEKHHATIFIQNLKTGQRRAIARFPGMNGAPAWSPDGRQMAVVLSKTGVAKIYLLNVSSGDVTQLTQGFSIDTEPAFSPDGQCIVFTSNRGGGPQIYRQNLKDGVVERVTFHGNYNASARYLHDGSGLVLLHRADDVFSIALYRFKTDSMTELARTGADESPSISPNDHMILYATRYGGRGTLAMVSTDRQVHLRLPARRGDVREPDWGKSDA